MRDARPRIRIDPTITTADGLATLDDIESLHNVSRDGRTGEGVTVAVMDTGIDPTHAVFDGVTVEEHDFTGAGLGDDSGHGTGVASLVARLAPDADIVSLRVFAQSGSADGFQPFLDAYNWLVDNADRIDVANLSWGTNDDFQRIDDIHHAMIDAGVQDVVAAGNTGAESGSPATATRAFGVGALTEDGKMTDFSSYDPDQDNPDVSALGRNVRLARAEGTSMGTDLDDDWVKASGTSFSAPITAALVARYFDAGGHDPVAAYEGSARDIPTTPEDGEGIVDYDATIDALVRSDDPVTTTAARSTGTRIDFDADVVPDGDFVAEKYVDDDGKTYLYLSEP